MMYPFLFLLVLCHFSIFGQKKQPDKLSWPRETIIDGATVTLYQPQVESFNQDIIEGRMAVSVKSENSKLTFGAVWSRRPSKPILMIVLFW
jgi:hypothetical protein